ncbi:hypothetical protein D3C83_120040 [compost metagenome]
MQQRLVGAVRLHAAASPFQHGLDADQVHRLVVDEQDRNQLVAGREDLGHQRCSHTRSSDSS